MRPADLFLTVIVVLHLILGVASQMGPSNTQVSGTFTGWDGVRLCKYCQIDCTAIPVFVSGSCANTYYIYGCDVRNACADILSANKYEFYTAIALCASANKCKFQPFLSDTFTYTYDKQTRRASNILDLMLYQDVTFQWRPTVAKLPTGADYLNSRDDYRYAMSSTTSAVSVEISSLSNNPTFKNIMSTAEQSRVIRYLSNNNARLYDRLRSGISFTNDAMAKQAGAELKELKSLDDESKRRRFREIILQTVTPAIPPSIYLYFKYVQDTRFDPDLAKAGQVATASMPTWFMNALQVMQLGAAEETGLAMQLKRNDGVRLERLMDWVNTYAAANYKAYFDAYQPMLEAATVIADQYANLKGTQICTAEELRKWPGASMSHLPTAMCIAVNKKNEMNAVVSNLEKGMNGAYRSLIYSFTKASGDVIYYPTNEYLETPKFLNAKQVASVFFRFTNWSDSHKCYRTTISPIKCRTT